LVARPSLFASRWSLVIGHWSLIIGLSLVIALLPLSVLIIAIGALTIVLGMLIEPGVGLIVTLLAGPWAAWMNVYYPGVLPIDAGQIMIGLTLGAWVLRGLAKRELFLPKSPLLMPLSIFVGWAAVTMLWALDLSFGLPEVLKWIEIVLIMLFTIDLARRRGVKWIVFAVLLTVAAQALIGLYEARVRGVGPVGFQLSAGVYRAYGTFEQPNPFGGFIGLGLPIALALAAYYLLRTAYCVITRHSSLVTRHALQVGILGLIASTLAAALYLSFSRGAWLGAAAAIGAMMVAAPKRRWIGLALAASAVVALIGLSSMGLLPSTISDRLADATDLLDIRDVRGMPVNEANYALIERQAHWQAALNMLSDKPWTGVGFSNYQPVYEQYRLLNWPTPLGHAHNIYLNVAAETGLPGFAAYVLLWASIFVVTFRTLRRTHGVERALAIGLLGVWVHLSTHMLVDNLYVNNTHLLIGAVLGLLVALDRHGSTAPHTALRLRSGCKCV
jgi:putative inorganic carbon (hco3(-)) transporter